MNLEQWAIKWGISIAALEDLRAAFGTIGTDPFLHEGESEAAIQTRVRLEASRKHARLWRNNVGALRTDKGDFVRYGLANDSAQLNKRFKSSDLIGIRALFIEQQHVGQVIGQFVAREVKPADWKYTATEREQAQLKFLEFILSMGGDAAFATGEGTL